MPTTVTPSPMLTPKEAARLLGVAPATLRNWRAARRGPPFAKIGGAVRYSREALLAFIESRTVIAPESSEAAP